PVLPMPPVPAPATVTQTVTVTPGATPAAQPAAAPAPAAPTTPALPPATSGTIGEFLKDKGVAMEPQKAAGFTALNIVLPVPTGWSVVPDPNVPDAFGVIADRKGGDGLYTSNAQLLVYKLVGDFDSREAISHGYVDSQKLFGWQSTSASMADFGGFPSSKIDGTYRDGDLTLNTSRRYLIADTGTDRYLLSLSVTTAANQVVATANATDGIINGFRVSVPGAATPAPAAPAAAPATPAPVVPAPPVVPQVASPAANAVVATQPAP
ncbi:MAG: LpqN/LpqT family lipoprotein, partial [Actinomycetota bacterium]|nr:LpqN/LpqT family lipoprotein [Actinomycetota bacterium]